MAATNLRNSLEGGTDSVTLTTGNSGGASGDAFTGVAAWIFTNVHPIDTMAIRTQNPGTTLFVVRWAVSGAAAASRTYVYLTSLPTVDLQVLNMGDTVAVTLIINSAGKARLTSNSVTLWNATNDFPINQWVRVELFATASTDSADGTAMAAYYLLDDVAAVEESGSFTALNTAGTSGTFANTRFGKNSSGSYTGDIYLDNVAADYGTTEEVANFVGPQTLLPPVLESSGVSAVTVGLRLG